MLRAALRDLQWRRRRFVIAVVGVALVFAMGLVMTGLAASFSREVDRTLDAIGARTCAVSPAASGPFTAFAPLPATAGGEGAAPVMIIRQTVTLDGEVHDLVVIGAVPGQLGAPAPEDGAAIAATGQLVVDESLEGVGVGDVLPLGQHELTVVGEVEGQRLFAGLPIAYIHIDDARAMAVQGQPLATAFLYAERPASPPPGLVLMSQDAVADDVLRPLADAQSSIAFVRLLLWIVAATIIGSVLYVQALERTRDFAVFKATGTSTAAIGAGLALQAAVLSLTSAVLAAVLALVLAPLFPMHVEIPSSAFVLLPVVTVTVGLVASLVALRRAVGVQPALAFGG